MEALNLAIWRHYMADAEEGLEGRAEFAYAWVPLAVDCWYLYEGAT